MEKWQLLPELLQGLVKRQRSLYQHLWAEVVIAARRGDRLDSLAKRIEASGGVALPIDAGSVKL